MNVISLSSIKFCLSIYGVFLFYFGVIFEFIYFKKYHIFYVNYDYFYVFFLFFFFTTLKYHFNHPIPSFQSLTDLALQMTDFSLVPFAFSDHCLNSFLQSTESSHSDLPQPNQQPMHRTKSLTGICSFSIIISLHITIGKKRSVAASVLVIVNNSSILIAN